MTKCEHGRADIANCDECAVWRGDNGHAETPPKSDENGSTPPDG